MTGLILAIIYGLAGLGFIYLLLVIASFILEWYNKKHGIFLDHVYDDEEC